MTTIAASPLTEALQTLVDTRLDTIDRMLLGRVNRQDRLAIVREVESQIFDLLQARDAGSLDRDDVLAVLARLDPPEAYLPDEDASGEVRPTRVSAIPRNIQPSSGAPPGRLGLASGVLGMLSISFIFFVFLCEAVVGFLQFGVFGAIGLSFVGCVLAIIFAARARLRGAWAVVGLVTGILSLLAFVAYGVLILIHS